MILKWDGVRLQGPWNMGISTPMDHIDIIEHIPGYDIYVFQEFEEFPDFFPPEWGPKPVAVKSTN